MKFCRMSEAQMKQLRMAMANRAVMGKSDQTIFKK